MSLKKFLLSYFYNVSIILGLFDFIFDRDTKSFKVKSILKVYRKFICIMILSTGPSYSYFIYYNSSSQHFTRMLLIMWSIEYLTLFLMTCILFYTVEKKSIEHLINEGIRIFGGSRQPNARTEEKSLKIFLIKFFAFDHITLTLEISVCLVGVFHHSFQTQILTLLCFTLNFISFFTTNAFTFILILVWWEFEAINRNMASDILHNNHLSFLKDIQAHRRLRSFCQLVIKLFSKICIANLLYAFTTTLSGVCYEY